jgi:hypothetical protein
LFLTDGLSEGAGDVRFAHAFFSFYPRRLVLHKNMPPDASESVLQLKNIQIRAIGRPPVSSKEPPVLPNLQFGRTGEGRRRLEPPLGVGSSLRRTEKQSSRFARLAKP